MSERNRLISSGDRTAFLEPRRGDPILFVIRLRRLDGKLTWIECKRRHWRRLLDLRLGQAFAQ